jgi:MFS family permease
MSTQEVAVGIIANSAQAAAEKKTRIRAVIQVCSGNFLEMYDFMIFGYYASAIGRAFFPSKSEFGSLMLSLATFGAGYLMRPLGGVLLGAYLDRHGRRKGLLLTLGLMAVGTLAIGILPGYETLGLLAPILVAFARLVQGLSAGVEVGGVSVYLSEIATAGRKGFYASWQSASQQVAVVFAAILGIIVSGILPPEKVTAWGWRIPMLVGCAIIPLLFILRSSLPETEEFLARRHHPTFKELLRSLASSWAVVIVGMLAIIMTTVTFYTITAYTPTFGKVVLHLKDMDNLIVTLCVGISNLILLPVGGALSDRVGRRPVMLVCTILTLLTAYPAMVWMTSSPTFSGLLTVELWLSILYALYNGAAIVFLTEIMPPEVRIASFSLGYSLAVGTFGGFSPAICTYLIHITGNSAMPGAWVSLAAALSLVAALIAPKFSIPLQPAAKV